MKPLRARNKRVQITLDPCLSALDDDAFAARRPERFLPLPAGAVEEPPLCNLNTLPSDIQSRLKVDFRSWKVKEHENLSKFRRPWSLELFHSESPR